MAAAESGGGRGGRTDSGDDAAYVDQRHREDMHNLAVEHRRQEQRMLGFHKARLQSHGDNHRAGEDRYLGRVATIDSRQQRAAEAMHKRHNSMGGRLAAMTKAGRARQEGEREALQQRGDHLRIMAHRNLQALQERQFHAHQRDRIAVAREMKGFRQDHQQDRQRMTQRHETTRPRQIEERAHNLKRAAAEMAWQNEMKNTQQQGRTRTRAG